MKMESVDLLQFFNSFRSSKKELQKLIKALDGVDDLGVRLLALEGLFRIEGDLQRRQLPRRGSEIEDIKDFLRKCLRTSSRDGAYLEVPRMRGRFIVFKNLDIPDDNMMYEFNLQRVIEALDGVDPAVAVLALEGLFRIFILLAGVIMQGCELPCRGPAIKPIRDMLRGWRCQSLVGWAYEANIFGMKMPMFLSSLTIFKTLKVPLFIDNYGSKKQLSSYGETENIHIGGETPICRVTHCEEADGIVNDKHFKPSAQNIVEGSWFGLDSVLKSGSVYGTQAFQTTLSKLGVTGLHQGEIVAYKHEVNVILYAADDTDFAGLQKPTDEAVRMYNDEAYVKVSVFLPSRFLPNPNNFGAVINGPTKVEHGPFCVKEKRLGIPCEELTF